MNLWTAKITAHASVFSYWKHVKAVATKGKSNSLLPESEPLQEPQGDLGHIRHGQSHQLTALMLPRGPTPDGHFSASWALGHELPWEQRSSNLSGSCTWARRIPNVSGLPTHPECSLLTLNGKSKVKSNVLNWKLRNVGQQFNFYGPVHVDTRTWLALKISPGVSNAPAVPHIQTCTAQCGQHPHCSLYCWGTTTMHDSPQSLRSVVKLVSSFQQQFWELSMSWAICLALEIQRCIEYNPFSQKSWFIRLQSLFLMPSLYYF